MTHPNELDRILGDWLAEGPTRAPDHPVQAAVEHARSHPRRFDPLGALRRDPMAGPGGLAALRRPVLVLASVGLLVVAVAAGALIGMNRNPSVVPPVSPSPSPSSGPSATPSVSPGPSSAPVVFQVDLGGVGGNDASVEVIDLTGLLIDARAGQPRTEQDASTLDFENLDERTLRFVWTGSPCDTVHQLTVRPGGVELVKPLCFGDAIAREFGLELTFAEPIDGTSLTSSIVAGTGAGGLPNWTATGPDSAGNRFDVSVFDAWGRLDSVESFSDGPSAEPPAEGILRITAESETSVRLTWLRRPCGTDVEIRIDAGGQSIELVETVCPVAGEALERVVVLGFDQPVDPADFNAVYTEVDG